MSHRLFEGKLHANLYAKYRPIPPSELVERIITFLKEKYDGPLNLAYDVGCGSGQSTQFLAPYFTQVVGTDVSSAQIDNAIKGNPQPNIKFEVGPAEIVLASEGSVQLITASQAAHWFDLPKFYAEGRRALCLNGVLALYGYELPKFHWKKDPSKNALLWDILNDFYAGDLKGYWSNERTFVDQRYNNFIIPYGDFARDESFYHDMDTKVSDLINYFSTWSGYQDYCKVNGDEKGKQLIGKCQDRYQDMKDASTAVVLCCGCKYY